MLSESLEPGGKHILFLSDGQDNVEQDGCFMYLLQGVSKKARSK